MLYDISSWQQRLYGNQAAYELQRLEIQLTDMAYMLLAFGSQEHSSPS